MSGERRQHSQDPWSRLLGGLTLLAVGLVFWLDHAGRIDAGDYLRWWPLLLIASALVHLAQRRYLAAGILAMVGIVFLPELPFLPDIRVSQILRAWPLFITAGGVTLMLQALRPSAKDAARSGAFRAIAVMGGNVRRISSETFVGGDAVAVMGGIEIELLSAPAGGEAVIDVLAFWGGIEVIVPHGWQIESRVAPILGAVENRTSTVVIPNAPRLILRGSVIMGGIEVRNPKEVMS